MGDGWLRAWALGAVALGGASLIVPLYVVSLGGTALTLGVLASSAAFVGGPAALVMGPVADRTGRHRELFVGGLALVTGMLFAIPMLASIPAVIVANAVIWFAFAGIIPVVTLLAVAGTPEAQWTARIARLNKFQGIGWAGGLAVGAAVTGLGGLRWAPSSVQRVTLLVYALVGTGSIVAGLRFFPRGSRGPGTTDPRRVRRAIRRAARFNIWAGTFPFVPPRIDARHLHPGRLVERFTPALAAYFLALFLFFAAFAAFFAPLPAYLTETGYTAGEIFALYVATSVVAAPCFTRVGELATRYGAFPVQVGGLLIRAGSLPLVAASGLAWGAGLLGLLTTGTLFAVLGLTWAVIIVTAGTLVTRLSPPSVRGESLGVYSAVMAVAGGVGGIAGGWLATADYLLAFAAAGGTVALSALLIEVIRRRTGHRDVRVVHPDPQA